MSSTTSKCVHLLGRVYSLTRLHTRAHGSNRLCVGARARGELTACIFSMCWKETKSGIATRTYSVRKSPEGHGHRTEPNHEQARRTGQRQCRKITHKNNCTHTKICIYIYICTAGILVHQYKYMANKKNRVVVFVLCAVCAPRVPANGCRYRQQYSSSSISTCSRIVRIG